MELKEVGEFGLIDLLKQDTIHDSRTVVVGIGDDAAVLLPGPQQLQLVTADMLVEKIHFDLSTTTARQLGYKSVAVNFSDIAAMGGTPKHVVVSIALPAALSVEFVTDLYAGMKDICREYKANIVGGDTVASPSGLVINVTALGEVAAEHVIRRSGARPGDVVAVTNTLGDSAAGLELLQRGDWVHHDYAGPLIAAHLTPRPQVRVGMLLAQRGVTSMDDISDGLASELHEIASASNVSLRIEADRIPLSQAVRYGAALCNRSPLDYALYGGEDFQLLFTMPPAKFLDLIEGDGGAVFVKIGEVLPPGEGVQLTYGEGTMQPIRPRGYNHFRHE